MTLQEIIDHLVACVTDMNENSVHDLALKAQLAIAAVDLLQSACADFGSFDSTKESGDWPIVTSTDTDEIDIRAAEMRKRQHEDGSNDSANYNDLDELLTMLGHPPTHGD